MRLGVCYYPEHWPPERWAQDARMMREAGLEIVRLAEFAWFRMEPEEGEYTWDWLDRAVDVFHNEGLDVVLGTPTPTPPAWLTAAHPEILPVGPDGHRRRHGSRRHVCANAPAYHEHTRRIVSAMAKRYRNHPAIIGWQTDNEFGCHETTRCYCDICAARFRDWLQARYGSLDALNTAWGTVFWSQYYTDWSQIQPPNLTTTEPNPSHVLDYYRFSSDSVVAYQQIQIDILRSIIPPTQFVTHNLMGNYPELNYHDLSRPLDFVTWDSYPTGYAEVQSAPLFMPGEPRPRFAFDVGDPYVTGFCHDIMRGVKQAPFWVMEQQTGNVNWSIYNTGVRPGAVRLWTWHALASGADAVVYFNWRACIYAQEQHHAGLLHHDASPDFGYDDVLSMLPERELMARIAASPHFAEVAILYDYDDLWALGLQPHRKDFGYQRHLFAYYEALQKLGIPADLVSRQADLSRYKLIIAPTLFLSDADIAAKLDVYVRSGGNLALGVRSGFKTPTNLVTTDPLPGVFRNLVGATVTSWHALPPGVTYPLRSDLSGFEAAGFWSEALRPDEGTRTLAVYTGAPFAGSAALTERDVAGGGAVFYAGMYPTADQSQAWMAYLAQKLGLRQLANLPEGVVACARGEYTVLLNFTEEARTAVVNEQEIVVPARDLRVVQSPGMAGGLPIRPANLID